jgi:hypothetical protein
MASQLGARKNGKFKALSTAPLRISAIVISHFGDRDQSGRWCCAMDGL